MSDLELIQYWAGKALTAAEFAELDLDAVRASADDPDYRANQTYVSTRDPITGVVHGHWYCRCGAWTRSPEQLAVHILKRHGPQTAEETAQNQHEVTYENDF